METFSALLAICAGNSLVPGEFPTQRPTLMFSSIFVWINSWVNNHEAGDLKSHCAHYDVIVMVVMGELVLSSFSIIYQQWEDTSRWNRSPWKTNTHLSCRTIPLQLMTWWFKDTGHQQPWYWWNYPEYSSMQSISLWVSKQPFNIRHLKIIPPILLPHLLDDNELRVYSWRSKSLERRWSPALEDHDLWNSSKMLCTFLCIWKMANATEASSQIFHI